MQVQLPTDLNFLGLLPSLIIFVAGMAVLLVEAIVRPADKKIHTSISMVAILSALAVTVGMPPEPGEAFGGMVRFDEYGTFFNVICLISAGLSVLLSHGYLERTNLKVGEYYALALFALFGMMYMATGADFILLFVALEIMSISFYVLAGFNKQDLRSLESSFKYFILGAFSSGILLYGIAFVYGAVGSTSIAAVSQALLVGLDAEHHTLLMTGMAMIMVGFGFKVAAAPFHAWAPDVYQGAPSPVTGYMATGVKAASFAAFGRVMLSGFVGAHEDWVAPLWGMAALTMVIGNLAALVQTDLKRMLAYSSIAHAGYILMALVAGDGDRSSAMLFYLLAYTFMNLGAFAVITLLADEKGDDTRLDRLVGLGRRKPLLAAGLALCLLSLAGIPPTMGFVGKFYLFAAAVESGYVGLAVVGALSGAVGVYYYLRPIVLMFMQEGEREEGEVGTVVWGVMGVAAVAILAFGVYPAPLLDWCRAGIASLIG